MNKRDIKLDKYGISRKRYKELCGFCEQYPDWKKEIQNYSYLKPAFKTSEGRSEGGTSDPVFDAALKLDRFIDNCAMIERVAQEADPEFWEFIIKSVCYEVPLNYLISVEGMNLSQFPFYKKRRYFFFLLDKERK